MTRRSIDKRRPAWPPRPMAHPQHGRAAIIDPFTGVETTTIDAAKQRHPSTSSTTDESR